ncbi:hypothetical protein [Metabacillus halosaccharovorans]|uniref:hypothetical protein n=1 Tax=Metabacillus halosaccharovorans TaxID=930124 RepID=UPI0020418DCF|nr:hypothetical protein [Metabacillus halosaccharovorans]MCM3444359.1 hypothetical protein [Metabacillus halosaccharovorans]
MFCVIQKIKRKKPDQYGARKELKVTSFSFTNQFGTTKTKYGYTYGEERFERPILDAYKISIHKSYREDGKVKKKQWPICTMSYYNLIEYSLYDCGGMQITKKAEEIGLTEEEIYDMIHEKLDPIIEQVEKEFQQTEEYKTKYKHEAIIHKYNRQKAKFNKKYTNPILGDYNTTDEYDFCYDVFGELRNPSYLKSLEDMRQWNENFKRSYQQDSQSNYSNNDNSSSYFSLSSSNYNENEKKMLKKIYREASKKFHPDVFGDDGEMMKFLTKLKEDWGI